MRSLGKKTPFVVFPELKKGVVNYARLRKAAHWPNNNANPSGLSEKNVYCSPEGFALLLGQCAALRSLAQLTTPFLAPGKAKNGDFSLRIAHIAPFYTINVFF